MHDAASTAEGPPPRPWPATVTTSTPSTTPDITWRVELEVAVRDGYQCRRCEAVLIDEVERSFVRIDPAAGDDLANIALVCGSCQKAHGNHPEPLPAFGDRLPTLT
jgi:hypothetical protein